MEIDWSLGIAGTGPEMLPGQISGALNLITLEGLLARVGTLTRFSAKTKENHKVLKKAGEGHHVFPSGCD